MGVASFPASGGGGLSSVVKSLQTGTASSSGTVTITAVNTAKAFVYSTSTGSAGTVAASGSINAANGSTSGMSTSAQYGNLYAIGVPTYVNVASNSNWQGPTVISYYNTANSGNASVAIGGLVGTTYGTSGNWSYYSGSRYGSGNGTIPAFYDSSVSVFANAMNTNGMNVAMNSTSLTGGTTSGLYSAQYGAVLTNSTTLTVTGPCTYQVIEYY